MWPSAAGRGAHCDAAPAGPQGRGFGVTRRSGPRGPNPCEQKELSRLPAGGIVSRVPRRAKEPMGTLGSRISPSQTRSSGARGASGGVGVASVPLPPSTRQQEWDKWSSEGGREQE